MAFIALFQALFTGLIFIICPGGLSIYTFFEIKSGKLQDTVSILQKHHSLRAFDAQRALASLKRRLLWLVIYEILMIGFCVFLLFYIKGVNQMILIIPIAWFGLNLICSLSFFIVQKTSKKPIKEKTEKPSDINQNQ